MTATRRPYRQRLGRLGESLAAEALGSRGYEVVAHNYRCAWGEIDLVARQGETWVFVEVRTRRGASFGTPEESVTASKKAHLIAAAQSYLAANGLDDVAWRIDFVGVEIGPSGELTRLDVIPDAVHAV